MTAAALLGAAALAGCTAAPSHPTSDTSAPEPAVTVTVSTPLESAAPFASTNNSDALPYWTGGHDAPLALVSSAHLIGADEMWPNVTASYEAYPYVATLGSKCLVLVGYDAKYREYRLSLIPSIEVAVFNRFGPTRDAGSLTFDTGTPHQILETLDGKRSACA